MKNKVVNDLIPGIYSSSRGTDAFPTWIWNSCAGTLVGTLTLGTIAVASSSVALAGSSVALAGSSVALAFFEIST